MFAASTVFLVMDLIDIIKRLQIILIDHPEGSLQQKQDLADTTLHPWMWTGEMLFIFMVTIRFINYCYWSVFSNFHSQLILGDSVVLWRTRALFRSAEKYLIVPILTWLGSVGKAPLFLTKVSFSADIRSQWLHSTNSVVISKTIGLLKAIHHPPLLSVWSLAPKLILQASVCLMQPTLSVQAW